MQKHLLWLLLCLCACSSETLPTETVAYELPSALEERVQIKVAVATAGTFVQQLEAQATVVAARQQNLQFAQPHHATKVLVQNGSSVKRGQLIAKQENPQLQLDLKKAQQEVLLKQQEYDLMLAEKVLLQKDTANLPEVQRINMRSRSGLAQAELLLEQAQLNLRQAELRAPFDGIIANLLNPAEWNSAKPLCLLYAPSSLEAELTLLETAVSQLQNGQQRCEQGDLLLEEEETNYDRKGERNCKEYAVS